ncbi:MAG: hypothetical protein AAFN92_10960 [Bacteroidota bacterium]
MNFHSILLILCFTCGLFACQQDDDDNSFPRNVRYRQQENMALRLVAFRDSLLLHDLVSSGDSTILEMSAAFDPHPTSVDDEFTLTLHIPVSNERTSFTWSGQQLARNQVGISIGGSCFCLRIFKFITEGNLTGERLPNGVWVVNGSVTVPEGLRYTDADTDVFTDFMALFS